MISVIHILQMPIEWTRLRTKVLLLGCQALYDMAQKDLHPQYLVIVLLMPFPDNGENLGLFMLFAMGVCTSQRLSLGRQGH